MLGAVLETKYILVCITFHLLARLFTYHSKCLNHFSILFPFVNALESHGVMEVVNRSD